MPLIEDFKWFVEKKTGYRRPLPAKVQGLVRIRSPRRFTFRDDGEVPNSRWPLIVYRSVARLDPDYDPAAIFETLFARHGWHGSWRDKMYDWLHYHSNTHEVLGIARGTLRARFGGEKGRVLSVEAGDVIILPAGVGHLSEATSHDLLIVGAYPGNRTYDECKPEDTNDTLRDRVRKVPLPRQDPVYGKRGPLFKVWQR